MREFDPNKPEHDQKDGSFVPDLHGRSREEAQAILKAAWEATAPKMTLSNMYDRNHQPTEFFGNVNELMDVCAQYGVATTTARVPSAGRSDDQERQDARALKKTQDDRKDELRREIRAQVARGELPALPARPPVSSHAGEPIDFGPLTLEDLHRLRWVNFTARELPKKGSPVLTIVMKKRADLEFFDAFYHVE